MYFPHCHVKMLVNTTVFTPLFPCIAKNNTTYKTFDLKDLVLCVDFGEEKQVKLSLTCDDEPKDALKTGL